MLNSNAPLAKMRAIICTFLLSLFFFPALSFSEKLPICSEISSEVRLQESSTSVKEKALPLIIPEEISLHKIEIPSLDIKIVNPHEWHLKKAKPIIAAAKALKKSNKINSISRVSGVGKKLSITFDGGWSDSSAVEILEVLKKKEITTTFFLAGSFIQKFPDLVLRIVADGHEVGNHTLTHPHLTTYSQDRTHDTAEGMTFDILKHELEETAQLFKAVSGIDMIPYWRAPFGEINKDILSWATQIGYQHVHWTVDYKAKRSMDSLDWVADKSSSLYLTTEQIKKRLLAFADQKESASGGIILMHLGTEREEDILHERLEDIIDSFQAKGYEVVPFSNLIKMKTPG